MGGSFNANPTFVRSTSDPGSPQPDRLTHAQRAISLAEFLLGGAIVIGHNVYHVIPNEVPILVVLGLISLACGLGVGSHRLRLASLLAKNNLVRSGSGRHQNSA